jgi:hypothetical protein
MLFQRIERELAEGEAWEALSLNRLEWEPQEHDCWEVESRRQQITYKWNFRLGHNFLFAKRLFIKNKN